jgi:ankyrin repeat protein
MGLPVNFADSDGRTPLIWAADRGELSAVEILLAKGAAINAQVGL